MGCIQSSPAAVQDPAADTIAVASQKATVEPVPEKPKPIIFALMRNAHEVIRGAQEDLGDDLKKGDLESAKILYDKFIKFTMLHMQMEEGSGTDESPIGMFKSLNMIAEKEHLHELHVSLDEKEHALAKAFESSDLEAVKLAFAAFAENNSAHLKKEEDIMMPQVMAMVKGGVSLKKVMIEELLPMVSGSPDFEFFVKFANEILEKHPGNMPRVRVFDHALWAVSTPEQWKVYDQWIKETLTTKSYEELQAAINA